MYLDIPSSYTANEKGARQVLVWATGNEKAHVIVMLPCTADWKKLSPYILLKCKTFPKGEPFPKRVGVCYNEEGWIDEALVLSRIKMIWCRHPGLHLNLPSILVPDVFREYLVDAVKKLLGDVSTHILH